MHAATGGTLEDRARLLLLLELCPAKVGQTAQPLPKEEMQKFEADFIAQDGMRVVPVCYAMLCYEANLHFNHCVARDASCAHVTSVGKAVLIAKHSIA